jgi:hypothetical protein
MAEWEYRRIDLNDVPLKVDVIDLLNDAGQNGWELVSVTPNNVAYLKRQIETAAASQEAPPVRATRRKASATK